ncbi:MAG: choice-of-anchor Q domain-containing protein, partial [Chloroflexota bacterium]
NGMANAITVGGNGGNGGSGGNVSSGGLVTIVQSTVTSGAVGAVGAGGAGGCIPFLGCGPSGSAGAAGQGGGIDNTNGTSGSATIQNTILALNSSSDCVGTITSDDYNRIGTVCGFTTATHDLTGSGLSLGLLANNGGPTQTELLQGGSHGANSAIQDIPAVSCVGTTDQRGYARPAAGATSCDIGSVESASSGPPGALRVSASAVPSTFFPMGNQDTVITGTVMGPPSDPTFASTDLTVTTTILSGTTTIRTLSPPSKKPYSLWTWDGKDGTGTIVPAGVYTATVTAQAGSGLSDSATVPITVLGDGPIPPRCEMGLSVGGPNSGTNPSPQNVVTGVNTQSGAYTESAADESGVPAGAALGLEWTRYYHSNTDCGNQPLPTYQPFGPGWTFTYDEQLIISTGATTVTHVLEDGQEVPYVKQG